MNQKYLKLSYVWLFKLSSIHEPGTDSTKLLQIIRKGAATALAQWVKQPGLRSLKIGATELT